MVIRTREEYSLRPIGHIRSRLRSPDEAPRQGSREISGTRLRIGPIEAIEGTPVVDVKPVLVDCADA